MRLRDTFYIAITGLKTNKSRSALTILGIVIGIAAIMLMMSLGRGTENLILDEIGGLGGETIVIRPGREPRGPSDIAATLFADSLKRRDVDALQKTSNVPDVVDVMPLVIVPGSISYEGETFRPTIIGGSSEFLVNTFNIFPDEGVFFGESDIRQRSSVVMIGAKVKKELFGESDPIGRHVRIKNRKFRVVGVFPPKGQVAFLNIDELVVVPYTTAQTYLLGIDYFQEIIVRTTGPEAVPRVAGRTGSDARRGPAVHAHSGVRCERAEDGVHHRLLHLRAFRGDRPDRRQPADGHGHDDDAARGRLASGEAIGVRAGGRVVCDRQGAAVGVHVT